MYVMIRNSYTRKEINDYVLISLQQINLILKTEQKFFKNQKTYG
jgi:hypothetical protein